MIRVSKFNSNVRRFFSTGSNQNHADYCANLVKKFDYENYLVALFSPQRDSIFAIRAFNIETATIQDVVTDTNIGKMRLEWWKSVIENTFDGRPVEHPVSIQLAKALESNRLSKTWFIKMLRERESHLSQSQFPTIEKLEQFSENTASSLLYLQLEALGITDSKLDHAIGHLGKAIGISLTLRGLPHNINKRVFTLPSEVMSKYSISTEEVFRKGPNLEEFKDVVFEIATRANDQLLTARSFHADIPKAALPVFLHGVPCQHYLSRLEASDFNLFDKPLFNRSLTLPFQIWKNARNGVF
ncbi:isoprenoid synthase domain-containing protein [Globomyces pollinis-pini]|nr:isoprenoid synthase domain-containing protein [Globomyces pollinis-pini]